MQVLPLTNDLTQSVVRRAVINRSYSDYCYTKPFCAVGTVMPALQNISASHIRAAMCVRNGSYRVGVVLSLFHVLKALTMNPFTGGTATQCAMLAKSPGFLCWLQMKWLQRRRQAHRRRRPLRHLCCRAASNARRRTQRRQQLRPGAHARRRHQSLRGPNLKALLRHRRRRRRQSQLQPRAKVCPFRISVHLVTEVI